MPTPGERVVGCNPLKKLLRITAGVILVIFLLICSLWWTLPALLTIWRPLGFDCQLQGRVGWSQQRLTLPPLRLTYQGLPLLSMSAATLHYGAADTLEPHWQFTLQKLTLNPVGWKTVLAHTASTPITRFSQWPSWQLTIQQLLLEETPITSLSVTLSQQAGIVQAYLQHPRLQLQARLDHQRQLRLEAQLAWITHQPPVRLEGNLQLSPSWQDWPSQGQLQLQLPPVGLPEAAQITLQWQGHQGSLLVTTPHSAQRLLALPWEWHSQGLHCQSGRWVWPYGGRVLQGTVQLQLRDWQRFWEQPGRGRQLLSRWQCLNSPWGAVTGQFNAQLELPSLTQAAVLWDYRVQGGLSTTPSVPWHSEGRGNSQIPQQQVTLEQLSATLAHWAQGEFNGEQLQLALQSPWHYRLQQPSNHAGSSAWQLTAQRLWLPHRRCLRQPTLVIQLQGQSWPQFSWQAVFRSAQIGPITGKGQWNGQRLQGDLHWIQQPLRWLQPLLPPQKQWMIKQGVLHNTATFTASAAQGFALNGLLQVKNATIGLKEGEINGIHLHLPYCWQQRWQVGRPDQPATLQIEELRQILRVRHLVIKAHGGLPYTRQDPLRLSGQIGEVLGGKITLPDLVLPQQSQPSLLTLTNIDLALLSALLEKRSLRLTGRVSGLFPVYTGDPQWFINRGRLWNSTPLTTSLDKKLVDSLRQQGINDQVLGWMTQLHIQQAQAQVQLDTLGQLILKAQLRGNPPQQAQQPVQFQYQHQENLLTLWRSLRASHLLQQQIEQQLPAIRRLYP